jgi:hypothetical protein
LFAFRKNDFNEPSKIWSLKYEKDDENHISSSGLKINSVPFNPNTAAGFRKMYI